MRMPTLHPINWITHPSRFKKICKATIDIPNKPRGPLSSYQLKPHMPKDCELIIGHSIRSNTVFYLSSIEELNTESTYCLLKNSIDYVPFQVTTFIKK